MKKFALAFTLFFSLQLLASEMTQEEQNEIQDHSIEVLLYRGNPHPEEFTALMDLAQIVAVEQAKGYLRRSITYRNDWHSGLTYCLYVERNTAASRSEVERIKNLVSSLEPVGDFIQYVIISPSNCILDLWH